MSCTNNTQTVQLAVTGGILTADTIIDPDPSNALTSGASGLFVIGPNETGWFGAAETWLFAGADAPSYFFAIIGDKTGRYSPGMRVRLKQGGGYLYFIITLVAYDGGTSLTTVTLYGGTTYVLANAAITDNSFSTTKVPTGFPADPTKWEVSLVDAANRTQAAPAGTTWYNPGALTITVPVGAWDVFYEAMLQAQYSAGQGSWDAYATLSTNPAAESDSELTSALRTGLTVSNGNKLGATVFRRKTLVVGAKTVYYLNAKVESGGGSTVGFYGSTFSPSIVKVKCAYL